MFTLPGMAHDDSGDDGLYANLENQCLAIVSVDIKARNLWITRTHQ